MSKSFLTSLVLALFLVSCGGGGGGGGSDPGGGSGGGSGGGGSIPFPTVSISSDVEEAEVNTQVTLTWSSTDANSCTASGAWSGTKGTNGSQSFSVPQAGTNTYSLSCSNATGSASNSVSVIGYRIFSGKTFDGYISGAEIFIDTNDNKIQDEDEFATTSATDGDFNLRYTNGTLISKNGTDADTQTLLTNYTLEHKLSGYTESKVISPITSLAAYFEDANNINAALGIDSTLDITITDPIPNKEDKGANSYLYEKGAQATVLALALTNIVNKGFSQNQDIATDTTFDMIAKELEAQYNNTNARVDIEREDFLAKVVDRLSASLDTGIADANKTTVSRALSNLLPIIEVKDNAEVTVAAMRFGLNLFQEDIPKLASGTASDTVFNAYQNNILSYIATDQGVNADELAPNITAIDDTVSVDEDNEGRFNVLNNDSYLTAYEIGLTITSEPSNGTVTIDNGTLVYQPELNYNGSDSITYQITQGSKVSSATVNITINPINDAPELNFASSFAIDENSTLVGVMSASDADGDDLEISLSGGNADLFTIDSNTFELSFKEAPDYESGNTSFTVTIVAADAEFTVNKDVTITVNNINDNAPLIDGPKEVTIAENSTTFIGNYDYSDADGDGLSFSLRGADSAYVTFRDLGGYIGVNLREFADFEEKGQIAFELVATDGVYVTEFSVVVTITNEFEELISFGSIDNPITTNADGTFIAGDDLSSGRGVFYMLFPGETSWDGWYARDYGGDTSIAASSTGTEFVTGEKNGSCTTSTGGQGSMSIYMYSSYRSYPDEQCFSDGLITGSAVDISYDGRRIATHVYSNNDHGVAIYDYSESGNKFFEKVQTLQIGGNGFEGNGVALSGDGSRVAWASIDEISVWEWGQEAGQQSNIYINSSEAYSVDLNEDGSILAYSNKTNGEVQIMDISDSSTVRQIGYLNQDTWTAEPFNMTDQANGRLDWERIQVSLDQSGTFLAIGFPYADNQSRDSGKVALYKYTDGNWDLYHVYNNESSDMETEHGYVALTSDASKVAIGTNNENSGFFEAFPNRNKQPKFDLSTNTEDFVVKENTTRVTQLLATDEDGDEITYSYHGKDAKFFTFNNGFLEFKQPPNYENPKSRDESNTYSVTLKASDAKNHDFRFFEIDVEDDSNEFPPANQIWGPSRQYGLGSIDMEMSKDGKRLVVLSDRSSTSSYKDIAIYEYDGNNYNLYYSRSAYKATSISISGDGNHIAWTRSDTYYALYYCDIRDSGDVDCYSRVTGDQITENITDIDLNFDASAVIAGSATNNNNLGRAFVWRRNEIEPGAWDANLGGGIEYIDVGYTGKQVQISDDGNRVAVVANRFSDVDGNPAVRIYEYQDDTSYQEVDIIRSEYQMNGFGESIDWSSDGRFIVVGSPDPRSNSAKNIAPDSLRKGAVYVYDCSNSTPNNNSACTQVGDIILGDYEEEWFGWRVAINDTGDLILVSSLKYPQSDSSGENRNGRVRAYSYANGSWSPTGYEYIGNEDYSAAGQELDMSADGALGVFSEPYDSSGAYRSGTIHLIYADDIAGTNN